jgi:hypothetical protein
MEDIKEITDGKKIPKKYVIFGFKDKSIFSGMNNLTFYNNENAYYLSNKTMNDLKPQ